MSGRCATRLLAFACLCLSSALVLMPASAQAKKGKKYALLVGITEYDNAKLNSLKYTENDVEEMAKVLSSKASGFDEVRVLSHSRGRMNAADLPTAENIKKAIDALVEKKSRHDTILIGLSGHGVQLEVKDPDEKGKPKTYPYFCPSDADFFKVSYGTGRSQSLVLLDDLFEKVGQCGATNRLVLIDACRNEVTAKSSTRNADVESVSVPKGVGVLFSCRSGEKAWETDKLGKGHGVFFYHVIKGIGGAARNTRDQITWQSLASYVCTEVTAVVPELISKGAEQTPHGILNLATLPVLAVIPRKATSTVPIVKENDDAGETPIVKGSPKAITNSIGMKLVLIPAGMFSMGSPTNEKGRSASEGPEHDVKISKAFYLGIHEVTQKQFKAVMGYNPSYFSRDGVNKEGVTYLSHSKPADGKGELKTGDDPDTFPVENVSWDESTEFCKKLSAKEKGKYGRLYRLPTEAEWEYACRGGARVKTAFHFGKSLSSKQANFDCRYPHGGAAKSTNLERTCQVGSYKPNGFGLYDMHGNVREWCSDWYGENYYADSPKSAPPGPSERSLSWFCIYRGGSWGDYGRDCRCAARGGGEMWQPCFYNGFRAALVPFK